MTRSSRDGHRSDPRAWAAAVLSAQPPPARAGVTGALTRICCAGCDGLSMSGAVVILMSNGSQVVAAASSEESRVIADLEVSLGEGPGGDAFLSGKPVLLQDLAVPTAGRWAGYSGAAHDAGLGSVFAFPLGSRTERFGAFTVYDHHPRDLTGFEVDGGVALADLATEMLLESSTASPTGDLDAGLESGLYFRTEIYQAQGMVMVALGVSLDEALARMRAHAFVLGRNLGDVALDIVAGELTLSDAE